MERDNSLEFENVKKINFNSHAHVERDDNLTNLQKQQKNFNSHAHVERDCRFSPIQERAALFQLTRSRGAWHDEFKTISKRGYFNSHAHVERDIWHEIWHEKYKNFNSHAHVERDGHSVPMDKLAPISTHTLTWSVTKRISFCGQWNLISTHTLTWSVTDGGECGLKKWGFQLTRSRGAWPVRRRVYRETEWFQLTRSRGAWQYSQPAQTGGWNFNSHAHVERDFSAVTEECVRQGISTHTLTWSVTKDYIEDSALVAISTHTLTWSVTESPPTGLYKSGFQLTRSRGAWHIHCYPLQQTANFNSHAHVERDQLEMKKGV